MLRLNGRRRAFQLKLGDKPGNLDRKLGRGYFFTKEGTANLFPCDNILCQVLIDEARYLIGHLIFQDVVNDFDELAG